MRIKFHKGKQREFLKKVLEKTNCPSLWELINRGVDINYSTLKNYFCEDRLMSEEFFKELLVFSDLDIKDFNFELVGENWGKIKGGKISKRN
jgi:hypothetical protein